MKKAVKKILGRNLSVDAYDHQKMPGIALNEIQIKLEQFKIMDDFSNDQNFKINKIYNKKTGFCIKKPSMPVAQDE